MIKSDDEIKHNSTYDLEVERNRLYAHIWKIGTDHCSDVFLEYYRTICLELEYRDQQRPKADITIIK